MIAAGDIATALERAFDRFDDFRAVQRASAPAELEAAVLCLQEAVGIGDAERAVLRDRIKRLGPRYQSGPLLTGVIVGLLATMEAEEGA